MTLEYEQVRYIELDKVLILKEIYFSIQEPLVQKYTNQLFRIAHTTMNIHVFVIYRTTLSAIR